MTKLDFELFTNSAEKFSQTWILLEQLLYLKNRIMSSLSETSDTHDPDNDQYLYPGGNYTSVTRTEYSLL